MAEGIGGSVFGAALGGSAIGAAVMKLVLDTKQYEEQLATTSAQTEAKLGASGAGGTFSKFGTYAAAGFLVAGTAAVAFASKAIEAYREHEIAVEQFTLALGQNQQALRDQANALQEVTGFDDDAVLAADALLSRFGLTADQLRELNPLILDFARATGQSVEGSALGLGRALLGSTRALKTVGINFKATGDRAKDFGTLITDVKSKVDGVAVAFGTTDAGQAAILNQRFKDLQETVGGGLSDVLTQFKDIAAELTPVLKVLTNVVLAFATYTSLGIAVVEDVLSGFGIILDHVTGGLYDFNGNTDHLTDTIARLNALWDDTATGLDNMAHGTSTAADGMGVLGTKTKATADDFRHFGKLTGAALTKWRDDLEKAISSAIFDLGNLKSNFGVTQKAFIQGTHAMEARAKLMGRSMDKLSTEKWVNKDYVAFLADQGPGYLVAFAGLSKSKQREMQADWRKSAASVKGTNEEILGMTRTLDAVPETKDILVNVHYSYTGYDASKPIPGT